MAPLALRISPILPLALIAVLSGCGGGSSGSGGTPTDPPVNVEPPPGLFRTGVDQETNVGGVTITTTSDGNFVLHPLNGQLDHNEGALNINITDVARLTDTNGRNSSGDWHDSSRGTTLSPSDLLPTSTTYVRLFEFDSSKGTTPTLMGVLVPIDSLRAARGTATYTGTSEINYAILDATGNNSTGTARATIDFDTGRVSLQIYSLDGTTPFDEVLVNNMQINMNNAGLSGGSIILNNNGANVTSALLGTGIDDATGGALYGLNNAGEPDEAGGMFTAEGSRGQVAGVWIAD